METRKQLLAEFMMQAPSQPATNYWRAIEIEEVIRYGLPCGIGLDLGCGDGHLTSILIGHVGSRDLVGIDIDTKESSIARKRGIYRQVLTGTANRLPFENSTFDFVFSNSVLEHLENIDLSLSEVARVLRCGGRFLFTVPGPDFHDCLKGPLFGKRESYLRDTDERCAHLRYWGIADWSEHLGSRGLNIIHHHGYLNRDQLRRWELIARLTSGILYKLTRKRKQPIELQRRLGIRNSALTLPRVIAKSVAAVLDVGFRSTNSVCGCLLIEATKGSDAHRDN